MSSDGLKPPNSAEQRGGHGAEGPDHGETLPVPPLGEDSLEALSISGPTAHLPQGPGSAPRFPQGSVVAGRFKLVRLLGRGGMGEVYLAEDSRLGRQVALKVLPPALAGDPLFLQRFRREARAASALTHPHVCIIHEVGEAEDGCPFMAMELVEGQTLEARLRAGPLTAAEIVEIGIQVTDALDAAHTKGIVHRDIKPANVILNRQGQVKVLDFGLAKSIAGVDDAVSLGGSSMGSTQTGTLLGTPSYMSPEQALARQVDHRCDIFSLGVLLYELITGRPPFTGTNLGELTDRIVHAQPEAMARFNYELHPELDRIVRKCLEKSPDQRFQSARELLVDLKRLRRDLERRGEEALPESLASSPSAKEASRDPAAHGLGARPPDALPVEALKESDVFVTYATVDDQPVFSGRQGWISQLNRNLKVRLEQLSGEPVRIWPQANPLGRGEALPEVIRHLPEVKTVLSVLSPPFVRSDGCREQVAAFWRASQEARGFLAADRPRVFKVVKSPVENQELPADVAPLLNRLKGFEFFEWDPETGRLREFDEAFGELARQRYHERVYDVAYEIRQVLKDLRARGSSPTLPSGRGKIIFLAATTADLAAQRDQLARELVELGHRVIPDRPLPIVASDLESAVRSSLEECHLAIHLVGDRYGLVPEDTHLSVVALQNQIAAEASAHKALPRFIWMPRGLNPRDDRQEAFVREITRNPEVHRGAEVVSDTLENFKVLLRARWSREEKGAPAARDPAGPPRVYLICDQRDEGATEPLEDFFYGQGIEVSLPAFEAAEAEAQAVHIRNLRDCDGAIIFYGGAGSHWVDFNIRDLQKAAGYRDSAPIAARAVFIAPPFNHRKERFKSVSAEVIRQPGEAFEPAALESFVRAIKAAKGGRR